MTTQSLFSPKMFSAKYVLFAIINHRSNTCSLFKYTINYYYVQCIISGQNTTKFISTINLVVF